MFYLLHLSLNKQKHLFLPKTLNNIPFIRFVAYNHVIMRLIMDDLADTVQVDDLFKFGGWGEHEYELLCNDEIFLPEFVPYINTNYLIRKPLIYSFNCLVFPYFFQKLFLVIHFYMIITILLTLLFLYFLFGFLIKYICKLESG